MKQLPVQYSVVICLILSIISFQVKAKPFNQDFTGQSIIVGGTGDSQKLLRVIAGILEEKLKGGKIEIPDTVGSSGGIKALIADRIDLARIARPLLENEKKHNLTYLIFAKNPVVFVTHPAKNSIHNLKFVDILKIYQGKIANWKNLGGNDHKIYPISREPGDASVNIITKHYPQFSVNSEAVKIIFSNTATIQALQKYEYTIGFLPLSNVKNTNLRILSLDGIAPTPYNIRNKTYHLTMPLGIAYKHEPKGLSKVFIDFLYSYEGKKIISDFGAIPVNP